MAKQMIEKGKIIYRDFTCMKAENSDLVIVSSESVDSAGDIIRQDGWMLDRFKANPQMLYGHDPHGHFTIGKWKDIQFKDGRLAMSPVFADDIPDHKDARIVSALWAKGFIKTVSVGFIPVEWKEMESGYEYLKHELLEVSVVPLPANTDAHRLAMKAIGECVEDCKKCDHRKELKKEMSMDDMMARMEEMHGEIMSAMQTMTEMLDQMSQGEKPEGDSGGASDSSDGKAATHSYQYKII